MKSPFLSLTLLTLAAFALVACTPQPDTTEATTPTTESSTKTTAAPEQATPPAQATSGPERLVGKPMPDFTMTTTGGETISKDSLKGKVVLLDFWATWCGPCLEASPAMQKLHEAHGDDGLVVIGANCMEDKAGPQFAADYAKEHKYTYTFTYDNDTLMQMTGSDGIPLFVLLDKEGVVSKVWVGYAPQLAEEIEEAVKPLL